MFQEILDETITTLSPTFDYNAVVVHLKSGEKFQPILFGSIREILNILSSQKQELPDDYNMVDTLSGARIIYKISEISYFEFVPDQSPLVYKVQ